MSLLWWLTGVCHQLSCDHLGANPQPLRHLRLQSFLGLGNEGSADPQLWTVLDHQHHLGADRGNTPHITSLMALFHCMVRFGTVQYGSLLGGFPLGTVPGTFLVPPRPRFQAIRTVTKTWRVNSADHWLAGENRHYCVTELETRDPT